MEKRLKFTGPFKNIITFDKKEILKKINLATFKQACRFANVYDALIRELYEEGCPTTAKYFQILIEKERILYKNASIRDRISDESKLLLSLFDNCKMAEKAALSGKSKGPKICTNLLLQCILMFENYGKTYDWILMDVFKIIIKIAAKVCQAEETSKESLCQIYYKFGTYQMKKDLKQAVLFLEKSLNLAQGTSWTYIEGTRSSNFSLLITKTYASALISYANGIFFRTPENAISEAQKALVILTGVGIQNNKIDYIRVNLDVANLHLKAENYERSLLILEHVVNHITPNLQEDIYLKLLSRYNHLKGICWQSVKKYDMALVELYKSLSIIRHLNMKQEEGIVLLDLSRIYIELGRSQFRLAESCLRQSKEIFITQNDMFNAKKASYHMANLKAQEIQPFVLDLIKFSPFNYCDKHRLIRWKSICLPFWHNLQDSLINEERKFIGCLLRATEIPERNDKGREVQKN